MFGINLKHSLAIITVAAGLGAPVYQHNQTDLEFVAAAVTDGTSNTVMFGAGGAEKPGTGTAVIESIGTKYTMFSGDAYDNEMGLRAARLLPDIGDEVL